MTWFRVDDGLATHQKPRIAGLAGMGLWVVSGAYSGQQLSDGHVPDWYVESWTGGKKAAEKLVTAGLWTPVDGGWQFHEWTERNPSREDELERRRQQAQRQSEWRERRRREKGM